MTENEIATAIVDACYRIHTKLGPGLFESVYEMILEYELKKRGFQVERQKPIDV
jgi:GxxExxY protein